MDNRPIGVFDSGIGGLTVLREIKKQIPNENLIYYADTARVPYGPRPKEEILRFSKEAVDFLIQKDIKVLVIACNTVTAIAYDYLIENIDIPVLGVIDPGVRAVMNAGDIKTLGLIATKATVESMQYQNRLYKGDAGLKIIARACPMLVSIVEEGWAGTDISKLIIERYLQDFKDSSMDAIILACTHFPVLRDQIAEFLTDDIMIIDPAEETAKELKRILKDSDIENGLKDNTDTKFYVSDKADKFKSIAEKLVDINEVFEVAIGSR
ncbi:MAG: glutamate racemase [Tissierellia bacterium]|nr:glutamate racemase [Tissierellia bacterium]